jgi:D-alanyl-D-alanine dipeptidase
MTTRKPYHAIAIHDNGEPLVPIPPEIARVDPHPYVALGAPYGDRSPFWLRSGVVARLLAAQTQIEVAYPGWRIQIFDAYRPVAVQAFMVEQALGEVARDRGIDLAQFAEDAPERAELRAIVAQFWAPPSLDPATPPPHSTGAALDITLVDAAGHPLDLGSPIDECSARSHPDHFADAANPTEQRYHTHRQTLATAMRSAGFAQHPNEWWHFSWGDQLWAWQTGGDRAVYGRVEPPASAA